MLVDANNIRKSIFSLSLPSVMEQSLMMAVGVVSTILVGRIGPAALSAVGLVNSLMAFLQVMFVALSTGCTVLVARLIGEGDRSNAQSATKHALVLGLVIAAFLTTLVYFFSKPIILLFFSKAESAVTGLADEYLQVMIFSLPLFIVNIMVSGALRGSGNTRTPMHIAYVTNIINIILSLILIFGFNLPFWHFTGLGIRGAAIAIAISRSIGGLLSLYAVVSLRDCAVHLDLRTKFHMDWHLMRRMMKVGIPATLESVILQGGMLMLQTIIAGMNTTSIAVYQVVMSINSICFIPIFGFGIAATTMVGQCLGAGKPELAEKCGWQTMKICLVIASVMGVILFAFPSFLVRIYSSDADVIRTGTAALRLFSLSQPILAIVIIISNALRGAGDVIYTTISNLIGVWLFRIIFFVLLDRFFHTGINGIWVAFIIDYMVRSILYLVRYRRGRWKLIVV